MRSRTNFFFIINSLVTIVPDDTPGVTLPLYGGPPNITGKSIGIRDPGIDNIGDWSYMEATLENVVTTSDDTDTDGDLVPDAFDADDDNDGMPDDWEIANGFDPQDSSDASGDPDGAA